MRITALRDGVFYAEMVFAERPRGQRPALRRDRGRAAHLDADLRRRGGPRRGGHQHPGRAEQEDEVEQFREFLDQISPEDFDGPPPH